jgi:hypothetical protein
MGFGQDSIIQYRTIPVRHCANFDFRFPPIEKRAFASHFHCFSHEQDSGARAA